MAQRHVQVDVAPKVAIGCRCFTNPADILLDFHWSLTLHKFHESRDPDGHGSEASHWILMFHESC